jgi:hypothetical protein
MVETTQVTADLKFSIIPEWVLDSDLSHKAVRVYAILARYADNETLTAWPARATIAAKCRSTVKSVDRAIAELVAYGAVTKQFRRDEQGQHSSLYTLRRVEGGTKKTLGGDKNDIGGATKSPHRTITNELEPNKSVKQQAFDAFWSAYPNKVDKGRARKAFAKIAVELLPVVVAGAERFASDPNLPGKQYIPYPATWLNGERWEDGPLPERGRRGVSRSRADENLARLRELEQGGR